jgi:S1-C subfamily serine protease
MLNLDMIGRNPKRPVRVFGDGYVKGLGQIVESANERNDLRLAFSGAEYARNSDHDAFYGRDIPFMFLFTGIHEDYHQVGDHADKLDYKRMARIVQLAQDVLAVVADADAAPGFIHNVAWLGIQVETEESTDGLLARIATVGAHSRARQSGLRQGDVLVAFDGESLDTPGTIGQRFRDIAPGTSFELTVGREGKEIAIALERARTGYLGIGPGEVDDEVRRKYALRSDEGVLVRSVSPGGPSDEAGLKSRDIILQMDGVAVSSATLRSRLAQTGAGETVRLLILRNGKRETLTIRLGERPERRS